MLLTTLFYRVSETHSKHLRSIHKLEEAFFLTNPWLAHYGVDRAQDTSLAFLVNTLCKNKQYISLCHFITSEVLFSFLLMKRRDQ